MYKGKNAVLRHRTQASRTAFERGIHQNGIMKQKHKYPVKFMLIVRYSFHSPKDSECGCDNHVLPPMVRGGNESYGEEKWRIGESSLIQARGAPRGEHEK